MPYSDGFGVLKIGLDINQVITPAEEFPKIKDILIDLVIDHRVKPVQQPYRRTPLALEERINQKIDELVGADIIEAVQGSSRWISPIVPIVKDNGDLRLCIDMRRANQAIVREQYPLPTIESYLHRLAGARLFSRLDIKNAFHQLELDKRCRYITTFISRRGLFRYKRLMFGINAAPEIFQRTMENLLVNCKNCLNYIDDIIVFGCDVKEHDECLNNVIKVLRAYNVLLNEEKCVYRVKELIFLGHHLSEKGIRPLKEKIAAIRAFREPKTREELQSFLGLVTYIGRFIPNLATETDTLRLLLKGDKIFLWKEEHKLAFRRLLEVIGDIRTLGYYDPKDRTQVIADASPVGLGAVLIQFKGETPRVISYASKSLTETEKRYCQTEKEALSLVWAVEKFYIFLCGIEFDLITDHKALETIFKPSSKPCARIERWVLRLQSFKYRVLYKNGKMNIADSLSRLGLPKEAEPFDEDGEYYIRSVVQIAVPTALSLEEIKKESENDPEFLQLKQALESANWKNQNIKQYAPFRHEISAVDDVFLRGTKIIIPRSLRKRVLEIAHEGHPGESLMKRRVRTKVWWPKIDRMVEQHVKKCRSCVLVSQPLNPVPMTRRPLPEAPWVDTAIDFLGPLPTGEYLLVIVDYYSRYQEIEVMDKVTSRETINRLEKIFCRLGFPKTISLDNGKQFVSREFTHYCKSNGIKLNSVAPYWPQANGEVERQNRSILKRLKISHLEERDWKRDLLAYLAMYYNTPHSVTGKPPAELFYGRLLRDKIPLVTEAATPNDEEVRDFDWEQKERGKELEDKKRGATDHDFKEESSVFVKNQNCSDKLSPTFLTEEFCIIERRGNTVTVRGKLSGKIYKRNISHIKLVPRVEKLQLKRQGEVWELE
ncbi:uncharacterized protein K02A2.6-like [Phlebotomus papatasi]|uniref:uncharacterized protein K02A2.6-like n=1 Tax=Phlebotomus papatasi TaxID=29031 RepID=UPI0024845795|nr:uncharacterized protein K02A2.6-like [Phlebotomus papatasi]